VCVLVSNTEMMVLTRSVIATTTRISSMVFLIDRRNWRKEAISSLA